MKEVTVKLTGKQVAEAIIQTARNNRELVAAFYDAAAQLDETSLGADAWAAELRSELMAWLDHNDQAEFNTYFDAQGREHAEF